MTFKVFQLSVKGLIFSFFYADGQGYVYLSGTLRKRFLLVFLFIVFVLKMNGPLQCSLFGFPIKVNSWQKYSCQDHISEGLLFRWISRSSENVNMNSFQNIFHLFSRSREVLNSLFVVLLFVLWRIVFVFEEFANFGVACVPRTLSLNVTDDSESCLQKDSKDQFQFRSKSGRSPKRLENDNERK